MLWWHPTRQRNGAFCCSIRCESWPGKRSASRKGRIAPLHGRATPSRASASAPTIQGRGRSPRPIRVFTDTGLRLGEALPLRREDFAGETLQVRRTAHEGRILEGTKTDHGEPDAGRVVPVPATLAWMLEAQIQLNSDDCQLLFPTSRGRLWRGAPSAATLGSPLRKPPA